VLLGRIPPHLLGGEIPLGRRRRPAPGLEQLAATLGLELEACAAGILEVSAWNQANALRQVSVKRGLDVRDFTLVTFGGSGSLLACRLIDVLGLRGALVPPDPGNLSAFGLLTVDVRGDYVRTHVARSDRLRCRCGATGPDRAAGRRRRSAASRGLRPGGAAIRADRRPALLRAGVRGAGRRPGG
jgi:N-methylhydantoinase A